MSRTDPADAFDLYVRDVHAQSLGHLSPRVQAQLAQRRRAALQGTPRRPSRGVLPWAGMASAGLALALVVQLRPPSMPSAGDAPTVAAASRAHGIAQPIAALQRPIAAVDTRTASLADAEAIAPDLSEDPDFYLWLADTRPANAE